MSFWIGVGILVLGLIMSIGIHELGHLLPAKRFGVYVPQYFIGFGPTLWSRRWGDTEYGVKLLPLGGYVRLVGMFPPVQETASTASAGASWFSRVVKDAREYSQAEIPEGAQDRAFYRLSTPKKLAVMFGGPVTNLILAILLFAIVISGFGLAMPTNKLASVSACVPANGIACEQSDPAAPAHLAGFREGDRILEWAGQEITTWEDITAVIPLTGTAPVTVIVERDGHSISLEVAPVIAPRPVVRDGELLTDELGEPVLEDAAYVGIGPAVEMVPQPLTAVPAVVGEVLSGTVGIVLTLPQRLASIAQSLISDTERDPNIVGPVGVGRFAGEIASNPTAQYTLVHRSADMLALLGSLNMALFVFNMIPLLPLDGGHIAGALYEAARRRLRGVGGGTKRWFADTAKLMPLTYVVFFALLGMGVLLAIADVVKPVTLG